MLNVEGAGVSHELEGDSYPLRNTAALLNQRLSLYLSQEQQRGLATGLLIGVALSGALIAWNVGSAIRRGG